MQTTVCLQRDRKVILLAVYVDDIILIGNDVKISELKVFCTLNLKSKTSDH